MITILISRTKLSERCHTTKIWEATEKLELTEVSQLFNTGGTYIVAEVECIYGLKDIVWALIIQTYVMDH